MGCLGLLSAGCALPSTAHTDVVFLLCHLWGDTDTDLMEPLVAAAVTLDPVHLVTKSRETGFSEESGDSCLGGQPQNIPAIGTSGRPTTGTSGTRAKAAESEPFFSRDCFGAETVPPCAKEAKGVTSASLPPSERRDGDSWRSRNRRQGRVRVSSRKGRRPTSDGKSRDQWGRLRTTQISS